VELRFDGKVVLVTGAAHGFGREITHAFAELGALTRPSDILEKELRGTAEGCPGECTPTVVDVTRPAEVRRWVEGALDDHGRIDVLVNNAGGVLGQVGRPAEEVGPEEWQAIFDVNTSGTFYCSQAVIPAMKQQGGGRIVNISSGAGLGVSLTGIQAYASAKAAQIGLTRQLAHELGPHGITVNNIAPGFVRSNPNTEKQWESYGPDGQAELIESIALRRLGSPRDIANAVLFFASEQAGWITGQVLRVDGGR